MAMNPANNPKKITLFPRVAIKLIPFHAELIANELAAQQYIVIERASCHSHRFADFNKTRICVHGLNNLDSGVEATGFSE